MKYVQYTEAYSMTNTIVILVNVDVKSTKQSVMIYEC